MTSGVLKASAPAARRSSLRLPGGVFAATTLFVAIGALNSQNNLLFWIFGLAVGIVVVSGLLSGSAMMGVRLRRLHVGAARVGEPFVIRYRVENTTRSTPVLAMHLDESDEDGHLAVEGFVYGVPAQDRVIAASTGEPTQRGLCRFRGPRAWTHFPFGFTRKQLFFEQADDIIVHPARLGLSPSVLRDVRSRALSGRPGARPSSSGDEVFAVREYTPGDSPRSIAWKASARMGDLRVRQFAEQTSRTLWLELDIQGALPHEVERAIALACTIAEAMHEMDVSIGVTIPAWNLHHPPNPGPARVSDLLDVMAFAGPSSDGQADLRSRDAMRIGAGAPGLDIDVREHDRWLEAGAQLPASLRAPTADVQRRTIAGRLTRFIDRLVGRGDE